MQNTGRYRAIRLLHRGTSADLIEAIAYGASGFRRKVVLKRLRSAGDEDEKKGFIDEARIASQLYHGNIVSVLDFGFLDELPFQALELVEGIDAAVMLRRARQEDLDVPPAIALWIALEIAHALAYVHSAKSVLDEPLGIVHRDISPHNVLLSFRGDVKLADFGIAYAIRRLHRTQIGFARGKLDFMAPEQALGDEPDARADIFSLGCLLECLLTGRSPMADVVQRERVMTGADLVPSARLDEDLRRVIARATRFSRSARHPSAEAFAADLGPAFVKRLASDPRTTLRDWLGKLRAPEARPREEPTDPTTYEAVGSGPQRRFASIVEKIPPAIDEEGTEPL